MRHRFRDTFLDGREYVVGDIYSSKEKKDLVPGDEVERLHVRKLDGRRGPIVVEAIEWPYVLRLRSK